MAIGEGKGDEGMSDLMGGGRRRRRRRRRHVVNCEIVRDRWGIKKMSNF